MRRLLVLTLLALLSAAPAQAYFTAGGAGSGTGLVATVGAGNQPITAAAGATVTVSWAQTSFRGAPLGGYAFGRYRITRYPAAGGPGVTPAGTCATTVTGTANPLSCTDTPGIGSWRYTVTPLLGSWTGAESPFSGQQDVVPEAPVLDAIVRLDPPSAENVGSLRLDWNLVAGATGYDVFRDGSATPLNPSPLTGTTFTDPGTGLVAGTSYTYVVRASTGAFSSASSNPRTETPVVRPAPPASVTAAGAPAARIDVSWPAVSGATSYVVFRRTSTGIYGTGTSVTGTTFSDTTAASGTDYVYKVRAVGQGASGTLQSADSPESAAVTADGTVPTVTLNDPGTNLRGPVTLTAAAADTLSGVASVRIERAPTDTTNWTAVCTDEATPYSCTATLPDGVYDFRAIATDVAGNTATSAIVANRRVDNTAPTGTTTVDATNRAGGTAGRPETGDVLTYTYSEALLPGTVLAGWTGASTNVIVRITQAANNDPVTVLSGTTQLTALGSLATGRNFVTLTSNFNNSKMMMSGSTITITLGTLALGGLVNTASTVGDLTWTIPADTTASDLAGNLLAGGTFVEADDDADF